MDIPSSSTFAVSNPEPMSSALARALCHLWRTPHVSVASHEPGGGDLSGPAFERAVERALVATVESVVASFAPSLALTPREKHCLRCLLLGMTNKETGASVRCSEKTIETHVSHLLAKAGIRSRLELVTLAWSRWALATGAA